MSTNLYQAIFLICALFILPSLVNAQHASCEFDFMGFGAVSETYCRGTSDGSKLNYSIPGNLDFTLTNPQTERLKIGSPAGGDHVAYENCTALPSLDNLKEVLLFSFNPHPDHPRFPLSVFLALNRHRIQTLRLRVVKLLNLTESDFRGFIKLKSLLIQEASLSGISVSTFESLGLLPSGQKQPPNLEEVYINDNRQLRIMDWSFLVPIANVVKEIEMGNNGLQPGALTCSKQFVLANASFINFSGNDELGPLPSAVFKTFNGNLPLLVIVHISEKICTQYIRPNCHCCELEEMITWLRDNFKESGPADRKIACRHTNPVMDPPTLLTDLSYASCHRNKSKAH